MASFSEKELGDQLIEAGNMLLSPPFSIDELLNQLDSLELILAKVCQAPPIKLQDALLPAMNALIANELLRHTDTDVIISVASCISEITRITAPDAPYNDKQMKECFRLTVTAFGKLSHVSSRSYTKAVSILETVAKVRSCLMMLDLECDELVIEMFQVFLKIIRSNHPQAFFENMEIIMTLIIEESEDISWELLSTLLDSVKKENQNAFPMPLKLGEKVISNCAIKLKSYLMKAVESRGIDLNDYVQSVSSICKTLSDNLEQNHVSAYEDQMVASELAPDVFCPGEVGAGLDGNRDTDQTKDDEASDDKNPLKSLGRCSQSKQSESIDAKDSDGSDNLETVKSEIDQEKVLKKRGRKPNSLMNPEEGYDHSWISREKDDCKLPRRRKKHGKVKVIDDSPSENPVSQEAALPSPDKKHDASQVFSPEISESGTIGASSIPKRSSLSDGSHHKRGQRQKKGRMTQQDADKDSDSPSVRNIPLLSTPIEDKAPEPSHGKHDGTPVFSPEISQSVTIRSTPTRNHNLPNGNSKRGRRQKKGSMAQQDADKNSPSVPEEHLFSAPIDEAPEPPSVSVKKEARDASNLVTKTPRHPNKKAVGAYTIGGITPSPGEAVLKEEVQSDFEEKPMIQSIMNVHPKGINEKGSSVQCIDGKKRRGRPKKAVTEESGEKKREGSRTKSLNESNLDVTPKKEMKRKRTPGREKGSKTPHSVKDLDERLVGSRIKVWWPKDKTFYDGIVYSFDHIKKKHMVLYTDGEKEVLNLGKERWELIGDDFFPDEGTEIDAPSHEGSSDIREKKENQKVETRIENSNSKTSTMKEKSGSSSKRFGPSTDKHADDCAMGNPVVLDNSKSHNTGVEPKSNSLETRGLERLSELTKAKSRLEKSRRKRNRAISVMSI